MPTATPPQHVEDKARLFLANGWDALYASSDDAPQVMDKQVVYLRGLSKKKSRLNLSTEQIHLVQRLVKGNGTKEEASEMISLLVKQEDGSDTIETLPEQPDKRRDVEQAKDEVRALLEGLEKARATFESLSVIAEAADPSECVYCGQQDDAAHKNAMHDFEGPEPEAVLTYAAQFRVEIAIQALDGWFAIHSG